MKKLVQELYASGVEMTIMPVTNSMEVRFYHRGAHIGRTFTLSSVSIGDAPVSLEKIILLMFEDFLKEVKEAWL